MEVDLGFDDRTRSWWNCSLSIDFFLYTLLRTVIMLFALLPLTFGCRHNGSQFGAGYSILDSRWGLFRYSDPEA